MEQPRAVLTITLNANGSVSINGPINDKIFCYGLLEAARKALDDYQGQAQQPLIMLPNLRMNGPQ